MRRLIVAALVLAACGGDGADEGPVNFGIVAGDAQTAEAGRDSLTEPVVGQAYRSPSGAITIRTFGATPLHAQTAIGTGVANVLTCAEPIGDNGMAAWQSCRETDAQGFVTYWFEPGTVAGESCAEIRATVNDERTILATTCASVTPGPVDSYPFRLGNDWSTTVPLEWGPRTVSDAFDNAIPWWFQSSCACVSIGGTLETFPGHRSIAPAAIGSGTVNVVTEAGVLATGPVEVVEVEPGLLRLTMGPF